MNDMNRSSWVKGARGEWYVAVQVALIALVFFGPRTLPGLPGWPASLAPFFRVSGILLMLGGGAFLFSAMVLHGRALTPLPHPLPNARLIRSGPYRLVRHPMYAGGVILALGWGVFVNGWFTLAYACVLFVFVDIKSRREERWLVEKFPGYRDYQRRVRKLIPFIY